MSEDVFYKSGLRFECTRCSRCCRHSPGYVFLSAKDVDSLVAAFGTTRNEFRERYCRTIDLGIATRVSLKEKSNFDCILWEHGGCSQYDARPLQCRSFPFWSASIASREDWDAHARQCPGMNTGPLHTRQTIDTWLKRRRDDGFLEV